MCPWVWPLGVQEPSTNNTGETGETLEKREKPLTDGFFRAEMLENKGFVNHPNVEAKM